MNDMETTLYREMKLYRATTNFLITGKCPHGVRPVVMNKIADIIAAMPRRPAFIIPSLTHRVDNRKGQGVMFARDFETAAGFAARYGGSVKTNLRLVQ